ncbi:MAG: exodeoxyribonuclease III [Rhodospirillaceae bacterium]|jgi:exodeoxyribonuclease III|nr:exodeoxyribonuclease III [Rhodospirillaceae bacterium]
MIKIATWNVNSIKARLPNALAWLKEFAPDVVLLQEIKTVDEGFPRMEIEDLGYNIETHGQKTYNGVAILSKSPIEDVSRGLPGDDTDEQARYIEGTAFGNLRVASVYLPNGNPIDTEKFPYKLGWMDRLYSHVQTSLEDEESIILGGDYNVIPNDDDVYDPNAVAGDALTQPESRARFQAIKNLGLTDALRSFNHAPHQYSYWDYQRGAWQKDNGLLIDHLLLTPQAADRLTDAGIDKDPRGKEKASDHTPVWCVLDD